MIDKPAGMTSFGVVSRVRRILTQQNGHKTKVGHCGTLDPFATGLLVLCVGKECKHAGDYTKHDKVYEAVFILGQVSSTDDPEGDITHVNNHQPTKNDIASVLRKFTGDIIQQPPRHSAIKINGRRAYELARQGLQFETPRRKVIIYSLELIEYHYPKVAIRAHVSSGTYIRSLAADIGDSLKTGAYCVQLRRTKIAEWDVQNALSLEQLGINS